MAQKKRKGTTLTPTYDETDYETRTDATLSGGAAGFRIDNVGVYIDDWEGGDLAAASTTILTGIVSIGLVIDLSRRDEKVSTATQQS